MMTIWALVGAALVPVAPLGAMKPTTGVADVAKKPDGYVRVMLLPAASAPPAEVVKMNVAAAAVLLATRSADTIEKEAAVTCPPITPDAVPAEAVGSALVAMIMPVAFPPVAAPTVKPVSVTVTAALAASDATDVVTTIWVRVGAAQLPLAPPLMVAPGVAVVAKKADGYVSVTLPPAAIAPPAEVVKMNVAAAAVLLATRSADTIEKEAAVTCPPITPELTTADTVGSALVVTDTLPAAAAAPMVKPVTVTVTTVLAAIA